MVHFNGIISVRYSTQLLGVDEGGWQSLFTLTQTPGKNSEVKSYITGGKYVMYPAESRLTGIQIDIFPPRVIARRAF